MPTPFEDLYAAVKVMMGLVDTAQTTADVLQAPTNYGLDFRVPSGNAVYQIQLSPAEDYHRGTVDYPRAEVSVAIHHYVSNIVNEEAFLHQTMSYVADELLARSKWPVQSGVFDLEDGTEPEVSEGNREGNVITFEVTATVLMDAA